MTDVTFVFPIHEGAIVTKFEVDINGKILKGQVHEKHKAQKVYESEVQAGRPAALGQHGASKKLDARDAMDMFQISLGNMPARGLAKVNFSFVQELTVEDANDPDGEVASVRLLVPAVTGAPSRYCPSGHKGGAEAESALQASSQQLPHLVRVRTIFTGYEVMSVTSPSHPEDVSILSLPPGSAKKRDQTMTAELKLFGDNASILALRSDFVLRVRIQDSGEDANALLARAALEKHPSFDTWAAMVELIPRFDLELDTNVEITFLVDRSGSMSGGLKTPSCRKALQHFVRSSPADAFVNIIGFGSSYKALFQDAQKLHGAKFKEALAYAQDLEPNFGGTEILSPLQRLFDSPLRESLARRVIILTDGEVWNQDEVLRLIHEKCGISSCQLFALGIGSGASTALIEGMARAGRGFARFVAEGEEETLDEIVVQMMAAALQQTFTDASIEWPKSSDASNNSSTDVPLPSRFRSQRSLQKFGNSEIGDPAATKQQHQQQVNVSGPLSNPADVLRSQSAESKHATDEEKRNNDLERFVAQGGVVEGSIEVPKPVPPVLLGQRWAVYAFLGRVNSDDMPTSFLVKAKRAGKPFEFRVPVAFHTSGTSLHALAARHLVQTLERAKEHIDFSLSSLPGSEGRDWQISAIGVAYNIATSQTAWLAVNPSGTTIADVPQAAREEDQKIGRLGSRLSVLSFVAMGSSLSVRSFARLGSSLSVFGAVRLSHSLSVLSCTAFGSSCSLRNFGRLGSSYSVFGAVRLSSDLSGPLGLNHQELAATDSDLASDQPRKSDIKLRGFLSVELGLPGVVVPVLPIWQYDVATARSNRRCLALSTSWTSIAPEQAASIQPMHIVLTPAATSSFYSRSRFFNLSVDSANLEKVSIGEGCEIYIGSSKPPSARIPLDGAALMPEQTVRHNEHWHETSELVTNISLWPCPTMSGEAYIELLSAQESDGSFRWPETFLSLVGKSQPQSGQAISAWSLITNSTAAVAVAAAVGLSSDEILSTSVALAILRRCFSWKHRAWRLVEQKALRLLQSNSEILSSKGEGSALKLDQALSLVNLLIVQRLIAVAAAVQS
eukprot:TRINITY_DN13461_c0_g1_i1.p1 TRINITY_DN13461_c0_g1~~TRINITY_DN13461_c0_g1_i1.p1  ORF type:complete len:1174 (+),score=207.22 TRINITY_DN13461_c0_g1_i1:313-3522(+)